MALRRRQQLQQQQGIQSRRDNSVIVEPIPPEDFDADANNSSSSSLAAKAIRASSAAHKDSSLSSAYTSLHSASPASTRPSNPTAASSQETEFRDYTSRKSEFESKHGFWGSLARKAKAFLDDEVDNATPSPQQTVPAGADAGPARPAAAAHRYHNNAYPAPDNERSKAENPALRKGLGAITSSLNYIGNAVEEGFTVVENRTAGIIQETRKHIRKKPTSSQAAKPQMQNQVPMQMQADQGIQLKASRDVAMAMAAKAKLLLRELKTVKADLAFAKERCAQLEEENRVLRESRERGDNPEDDDLIRLQLESLLGEKARLAHENSVYARENRFLREVVEYHQLTMQDVVYLDEKSEEVTEIYPPPPPPPPTMPFIDSNVMSSLVRPVPPPAASPSTSRGGLPGLN